MPSDSMYVPVQAGALGRESIPGFARDDECGIVGGGGCVVHASAFGSSGGAGAVCSSGAENAPSEAVCDEGISALNPHLSELTVAYWAWKNFCGVPGAPGAPAAPAEPAPLVAPSGYHAFTAPDAIGLVHYRRHFAGSGDFGTLTTAEAQALLAQVPVVLPRQRNYVIESVGSHYAHTFQQAHLDLLLSTVGELAPEYAPALRRRLAGTRAHMFNMFIMRRDLFDAYMTWLFTIIGQVECEFDYAGLAAFEARCPGRLSEFLLDTWLDTNDIPYVERPVKDMEPVNWPKKVTAFLAAKFANRKYDKSF